MDSHTRKLFMFSGQGTQYYQMGRALYDQGGTFARQLRALDTIVQDLGGASVVAALYGERSKADLFDELRLTHPAIVMVEYALARTLIERGHEPAMTLGVSLGAVTAAVVAGCLEIEEALAWVVRQAAWIAAHCEAGGMIGVLAPPQLHDSEPLRSTSVIAARNGPSHWVLAARAGALAEIERTLSAREVAFGRLPVQFAFHSPWLVADRARACQAVPVPALRPPRLTIACCAEGGVIETLAPDYFWRVMLEPIAFARTIASLEARGGAGEAARYIDCGPSPTLATLLKHQPPPAAGREVHVLMTPYGRDVVNLAALAAR